MPSLGGWIAILLLAPGAIVIAGVVVAFLLRGRGETIAHDAQDAGLYHVLGVDEATGARREATVGAGSRNGAIALAQREGIVVTAVTRVDRS